VATLAVGHAPFSAQASQPGDDHARAAESFREAQAAFERRDYAAAAAAFEQAAHYEPHPAPLLDAADAWERLGDYARAAEDCDRVLSMPGAPQESRADAERRLARLLSNVATLTFRGPRTVLIRIDGGTASPPTTKRRLAPGRHVVAIDDLASQQNRVEEIVLAAGAEKVLDVTVAPPKADTPPVVEKPPVVPPPRSAEAPPSSSSSTFSRVPLASWISLGLAGASGALAVTFSVMTMKSRDDYNHTPTIATRDAFYRNRLIANIGWGAAAALAATAVVIWQTSDGGARVSVAPSKGGAQASLYVSLP
jgi:hypothetical protein